VIAEEEAGEGDSGDAGGGCDVKQVDALSPLPPATLHHQARPVLTPQLLHLNLSRNPLGGAGLTNLCAGLQHCTMLKVLNLHSIGLTEDDVPALETLAAALQATSLDQIDLGANFFGDGGAAALVNSTHTRKLRTTAHGLTRGHGDEGSMLLTSLVRKNLPAKKKAGGKKKKA
jgi:Ran GTPase-activating protein (RanGAP) involved in mRNA processing and transport